VTKSGGPAGCVRGHDERRDPCGYGIAGDPPPNNRAATSPKTLTALDAGLRKDPCRRLTRSQPEVLAA